MASAIRNILIFILLWLFQALVLNNVLLAGIYNPMPYVMWVLILPISTRGWVMLLTSFALGLGIDLFENTHGLHAFSLVTIAYVRNFLFRGTFVSEEFDDNTIITLKSARLGFYIKYSGALIVIHHFIFFLIDYSGIQNIFRVSIDTLANAAFSLIIIYLIQLIFFKPARN